MSDAALLCVADLGQGLRTVVRNAIGPWTLVPTDNVFDETSVQTLAWAVGAPASVRRFVRTGRSSILNPPVTWLCEVWELPTSPFQIAAGATATMSVRYTHPLNDGPSFPVTLTPMLPTGDPEGLWGFAANETPQGRVFYTTAGARHEAGETVWLLRKSLGAAWVWLTPEAALGNCGLRTTLNFAIGGETGGVVTAGGTDGLRVLMNGVVGYDDKVAAAAFDWTGTFPLFTCAGGTSLRTSLAFSLHRAISPTFQTLTDVHIDTTTVVGGGQGPFVGIPVTPTGPAFVGAIPLAGGDFAALYADQRSAPAPVSLIRSVGSIGVLPSPVQSPIGGAEMHEQDGRLYIYQRRS